MRRKELREKSNEWMLYQTKFVARILIDCSYESLMTEREIKSLLVQLKHIYSKNKSSFCPSKIVFAGLTSTERDKLVKNGMDNWHSSMKCYPDSFESYVTAFKETQNFLYLSAEAEREVCIADFKENTTFVVGGLVDKNRHKGKCLETATRLGFPSAKFQLREFFRLRSQAEGKHFIDKTVLNLNHVCGILNEFNSSRDWVNSYGANIPRRRGQKRARSKSPTLVEKEDFVASRNPVDIKIVFNVSYDIDLKHSRSLLEKNRKLIIADSDFSKLLEAHRSLRSWCNEVFLEPLDKPIIEMYLCDSSKRYSLYRLKHILSAHCDRIENLTFFIGREATIEGFCFILQALFKYLSYDIRMIYNENNNDSLKVTFKADQRGQPERKRQFKEFQPTLRVFNLEQHDKNKLLEMEGNIKELHLNECKTFPLFELHTLS